MDIDVARKVFRYVVMIEPTDGGATIWNLQQRQQVPVPLYSSRVEDAHLVMDHFRNNGWRCVLNSNVDKGWAEWTAEFTHGRLTFSAQARTVSEAICKVALTATNTINTGNN